MDLQAAFRSKPVIELGLLLARFLPPWAGYRLAGALTWLVCRLKPAMYHTVQGNLRQIAGPGIEPVDLDELTSRLFRHAGKTAYDFFHAIGQPPAVLAQLVPIPAAILSQLQAAQAAGRGVLILGIHMSNFDLAMLSFGLHGLPIQALSLENPQAGFRVLNLLREEAGFEITPITPRVLRQAIQRLKRGGIVMAAADWPDPGDGKPVPFFGRPAYLPLGPARLALLTGADVFLAACHHTPEAGYLIEVSGPIEMTRSSDRQADIYHNTRYMAEWMEVQIRAYPDQWMMFHPFWPENGEG